jgi:adenylate cyclase
MRRLWNRIHALGPQTARDDAELYRRTRIWVIAAALAANTAGACVVFVFAAWVVPTPEATSTTGVIVNLAAGTGYLLAALVVGVVWGTRSLVVPARWLLEGREPDEAERRFVLLAPLRLAQIIAVLWAIAAVVFAALNLILKPELAVGVGLTVVIGGIATAAVGYLLFERILRASTARALRDGLPEDGVVPGVLARAVLAWALGTGVPVLGLVLVGLFTLVKPDRTPTQLAVTILALGGAALVVGLLVAVLAARATADPVVSVRDAQRRVERGDLDVQVPVYDGSEAGLLQAGFNRMVGELRERERLREVFGTYVDEAVAEHILEEGVSLDGEEIDVTLLFLDVRDFTGLAESTPAREVVAKLNELFEAVVPVVHDHRGHVDKFVGDGLLAVFGAPRRSTEHADDALAAALQVADCVEENDFGLEVGIGLSSGKVIAGNVGGAGRLEFSVIGDAVNVAARVEAATRQTGDVVLLSEHTAERLSRGEAELTERPGVELRGRSEGVTVYAATRAGATSRARPASPR